MQNVQGDVLRRRYDVSNSNGREDFIRCRQDRRCHQGMMILAGSCGEVKKGTRTICAVCSGPKRGENTMRIRVCLLGFVLLCTAAASSARLDQVTKGLGLGSPTGLSDSKVASGLKQALQIGTNNAVKLTGRTDGYFGNQAIKIQLPKNLQPLEKGLGAIGYESKIDAFVLSMNRAAEAAAPSAKKIFVDAPCFVPRSADHRHQDAARQVFDARPSATILDVPWKGSKVQPLGFLQDLCRHKERRSSIRSRGCSSVSPL